MSKDDKEERDALRRHAFTLSRALDGLDPRRAKVIVAVVENQGSTSAVSSGATMGTTLEQMFHALTSVAGLALQAFDANPCDCVHCRTRVDLARQILAAAPKAVPARSMH